MRILVVCLLFLPLTVFSKTLIVSDIDDTIKASHVLSLFDSAKNALDTDDPMHGMSLLYHVMKSEIADSEIAYVTNASPFLMENSHLKFLKRNQFPSGKLLLRKNIFDQTFKFKTISNLINTLHPDTVILIGDNGEKDNESYKKVVDSFKQSHIHFFQFIRIDYDYENNGKHLLENQKGFITSAEIALELFKNKILNNTNSLENIISSSIQEVPSDNEDFADEPLYLPGWVTCSQHNPDLSDVFELSPKVEILQKMIFQRCFN